jgi:hypothetical protein
LAQNFLEIIILYIIHKVNKKFYFQTIKRVQTISVDFSCTFENELEVYVGGTNALLFNTQVIMASQNIDFTVTMGMFLNADFTEVADTELTVTPPELMYVQIALVGGADGFVVQAQQCWASPS